MSIFMMVLKYLCVFIAFRYMYKAAKAPMPDDAVSSPNLQLSLVYFIIVFFMIGAEFSVSAADSWGYLFSSANDDDWLIALMVGLLSAIFPVCIYHLFKYDIIGGLLKKRYSKQQTE